MLFFLSLLDKIKVGGDSCLPQHFANTNAKRKMQTSIPKNNPGSGHRIIELAPLLGKLLKSGVTLGLDHLYLLSLFDLLYIFGSLFGLFLDILHPDLGHIFR